MDSRQILTARLRQSTPLSEGTHHLEFEVEEMSRFDFTAGQFVSMKSDRDGREITRAYSIASAPKSNNVFDVCLNRVEFGFFSNYLCDLKGGARVRFNGPHGTFVLKKPARDSIFIGTGTGIAPLRGMIQWLFEENSRNDGHEFWLVFGVRFRKDLYYHDEFVELERERSNFHYVPTLSRDNPGWTGATGYVQEHARKIVGSRTDMDAYICGLKDMVKANRDQLKDIGWDRKSILFERYD